MMTLFVVAVLLVLVKCSYFYALRFLLIVCLAHTHFTQKSLLQLSNNSSYLFDAIYVSRTFLRPHTNTHPSGRVHPVKSLSQR